MTDKRTSPMSVEADRQYMGSQADAKAALIEKSRAWRQTRQPSMDTAAGHRKADKNEHQIRFELANAALLWLWHEENPAAPAPGDVGEIVRKMIAIADASRRADGSDIPLGEQCREAANALQALSLDIQQCVDANRGHQDTISRISAVTARPSIQSQLENGEYIERDFKQAYISMKERALAAEALLAERDLAKQTIKPGAVEQS